MEKLKKIAEKEEEPQWKRREIVKYLSSIMKLMEVNSARAAIEESLARPELKIIVKKGTLKSYHQKKLRELNIIESTKEGYVVTEEMKHFWMNFLADFVGQIRKLKGKDAAEIFNSPLSFEVLLALSSGQKTFDELRKELGVHEGSLSRALKRLDNLVIITKKGKRGHYFSINPLLQPSTEKISLLINSLIEKRWIEIYAPSKEKFTLTSVLPLREKVAKNFEILEKEYKEEQFYRYEDLLEDHIIITYSYATQASKSDVIKAIIKEQSGFPEDSKYLKPILTLEKGKIRFGYDINYISSLQQVFNLFALFDNPILDFLTIEDIEFPKEFSQRFKGPLFGREGIREILGVYDRPLLQATFLPTENLDIEHVKKTSRMLFLAGVDEMSDHRTMIEGVKNFRERVHAISEVLDYVRETTDQQKIYYFHIYGEDYEERLDILKESENKGIGVALAPLTFGIPLTLRVVNDVGGRFPILFGLLLQVPFTRYARKFLTERGEIMGGFGISMKVLTKFFVLLGGDEIVVDPPLYRSPFSDPEEVLIECKILDSYFKGFKKPFPVFMGKIRPPTVVSEIIPMYGKDVVLNFTTWSLRIAEEKYSFNLSRSVNAFKQAIEIGMHGWKEVEKNKNKYKDFLDSLEIFKEI